MKKYTLFFISALPFTNAFTAVTLNLDVGGLTNSSGVITDGMEYGIVVDTDGNGFEAGSYDGFDITKNGQFLSTSSGATDDWFVYSGTLASGQTPPTTSSLIGLGSGSIGSEDIDDVTNLSSGDEFAVMWFPGNTAASSGDDYGLFTDTGSTTKMILPGLVNGVSSSPDSVSTKSVDFQVVPEPSFYGLAGLLGFFWLVVRRRASI